MLCKESFRLADILARKLESFVELSDADRRAVHDLCDDIHVIEGGTDLIREGERPEKVFLLLEGWAFRYKMLHDGKRQILAYLIPGDLCDIHIFVLKKMDHGIGLLSQATVAAIKPEKLLEVMREHRNVERALWWATLVDEAILREWLVNLGQRDAYERIAHLLYEMWLRARLVGLVSPQEQFSLPLTQAQLGDTVGLTPVAVNRALQRLRSEGLISLGQKQLTIPFPARLAAASSFEPNYLHLHQAADSYAKLRF